MKGDAWLARGALRESARAVLARTPDAAPRVRLFREVLRCTSGDGALDEARVALDASRHVRALVTEQRRDGGFGRFHSGDSTLEQRIPTTEWGIERALALGLDAAHPTLVAARGHLLELLRGGIPFPDRAERNDRWEAGTRLFVASALSRLDPDAPALEPVRRPWIEIARRTLAAGRYDAEAEARAHAALTGASVRNSYLVLTNKYALVLLASRPGALERDIERTLVRTLWSSPRGIGYLGAPLGRAPPPPGFRRPLANLAGPRPAIRRGSGAGAPRLRLAGEAASSGWRMGLRWACAARTRAPAVRELAATRVARGRLDGPRAHARRARVIARPSRRGASIAP